jgi:hypothetical protein
VSAEILQFPRRDLRSRAGRMFAARDAVASLECTLPARARLLVHVLALVAFEREDPTLERLARYTAMRPRTVRKYLAIVQAACGEEPAPFISSVINGQRPLIEWFRALETHGGRHAA